MTGALGLFLIVWALVQLFCAWIDRVTPGMRDIPRDIRHNTAFVVGCGAGLAAIIAAKLSGVL